MVLVVNEFVRSHNDLTSNRYKNPIVNLMPWVIKEKMMNKTTQKKNIVINEYKFD